MARTLATLIGLGCVVLGLLYVRSTRTSAELAAQLTALRSANQQQLAELNQAEHAQAQLQKQLLELDADLGATSIPSPRSIPNPCVAPCIRAILL